MMSKGAIAILIGLITVSAADPTRAATMAGRVLPPIQLADATAARRPIDRAPDFDPHAYRGADAAVVPVLEAARDLIEKYDRGAKILPEEVAGIRNALVDKFRNCCQTPNTNNPKKQMISALVRLDARLLEDAHDIEINNFRDQQIAREQARRVAADQQRQELQAQQRAEQEAATPRAQDENAKLQKQQAEQIALRQAADAKDTRPPCGSDEAIDLVKNAIKNSPAGRSGRLEAQEQLEDQTPKNLSFFLPIGDRMCWAKMLTNAGVKSVQYTFHWKHEIGGDWYVEVTW